MKAFLGSNILASQLENLYTVDSIKTRSAVNACVKISSILILVQLLHKRLHLLLTTSQDIASVTSHQHCRRYEDQHFGCATQEFLNRFAASPQEYMDAVMTQAVQHPACIALLSLQSCFRELSLDNLIASVALSLRHSTEAARPSSTQLQSTLTTSTSGTSGSIEGRP